MTDENNKDNDVTPGSSTSGKDTETGAPIVTPAPGATTGATGTTSSNETSSTGTSSTGTAGTTTGATSDATHASAAGTPGKKPWGMDLNVYCMLLHLSQLLGFVVPGLGLVLPIVMWATNKDEYPAVNLHGLIVLNWLLSALIYFIVFFILSFIIIGIPLMFALLIAGVVFAVIGGVKANDGKYWAYPLSIDFFGVKKKLPTEAA